MPLRELLLDSHMIAVIAATGIGLLAFPGADLARSAQPALVRMVAAAEPEPAADGAESKGPQARLTGALQHNAVAPASAPAPVMREAAPLGDAAPPSQEQPGPAPEKRAFEGCVQTYEHAACRRAFEAAVERHGGFALTPTGNRLGSQPLESLSSLDFEDGPRWRRTLESVSEHGITFKRLRRGNEHELAFGINRDGVLGFTLQERASER